MAGALQDVAVTLNGKPHTLRYSIRATEFLKRIWALDDDRAVQARMAKATTSDFIDIFWAGLQTHHRDEYPADGRDGAGHSGREKVLDALDAEGMDGMAEMISEAMTAATPPKPKGPPAQGRR